MVTVNFSTILRSITNNESSVSIEFKGSIRSLLEALSNRYGETFSKRVLDNGQIRRYINIYVNGEDIRFLQGLDTELKSTDVIDFIPSVSGGC